MERFPLNGQFQTNRTAADLLRSTFLDMTFAYQNNLTRQLSLHIADVY